MKAYLIRMTAILLLFGAVAFAVNTACHKMTNRNLKARNVVVQRIADEIEQVLGSMPDGQPDPDAVIEQVFRSGKAEWDSLYGSENSPYAAALILLDGNTEMRMTGGDGVQVCGIYLDDRLAGIAEFRFRSSVYDDLLSLLNLSLALCGLFIIGYAVYMYRCLIRPFNRLSDYPERLSKGMMTEKIPESRSSFWGRYIWSMNMLSDKLENDRQTYRKLIAEREAFVTALVHGIKTPAANIKLLSEAICTGLYNPEGKICEKDAELAEKIEKHADEIEGIVSRVVKESTTAVFDYNPDTEPFYSQTVVRFIQDEFANRLKVSRIPLTLECEGNPMIRSDFEGVCRILRQLMDNAIKYGDGTGITVTLTKQDEGHFITVSNCGEPLPESEVHFVFNSMWRGSNAAGVNGSGIGLYEARLIAKKLGGDIRMRTTENSTAVTLFLPE